MKIFNCRGIGVGQVIITTAVIIFIVLPIFTIAFEKTYVKVAIHNYEEIGDMAIMAAVSQLSTSALAQGILSVSDIQEVSNYVYNEIIKKDDDYFNINTFSLNFYNKGQVCSDGFASTYNFFHIKMNVRYKRLFNESNIINFIIHMDVEIPIDR